MNVTEWAAVAGIALTTGGGIVAGVVHSNKTSFQFGEHSQRLKQAEDSIAELKAAEREGQGERTQIALLTQAMSALQERFEKLDHDLRGYIMGKYKTPRSASNGPGD